MTTFGVLPADVVLARTTGQFDVRTVPSGLLRAHQVAAGVWGCLVVHAAPVTFVFEDDPDAPLHLAAGDRVVIPPERPHHVELGAEGRFSVEFHRKPAGRPTIPDAD